jgi:hypothetical protein
LAALIGHAVAAKCPLSGVKPELARAKLDVSFWPKAMLDVEHHDAFD